MNIQIRLALIALLFVNTGCRVAKNFHEVRSGEFYRSAQLTKKEFESEFKNKGIKTVINLRGAAPGKNWYEAELAAAREYGVEVVDIQMSARRLPHKADIVKLLDAYATAERPILIHCKAGADRTGEAAAIYQFLYLGKSKEEAKEMLSPKYFHFEQFYPAKDYFFRIFESEDWARGVYDPCSGQYEHYNINTPPCTSGQPEQITEDEDT